VTGVGAELIASTFNTWYDPGKVSEEWFDRTHNIYIDYLLQFGIFGLMAYLALLIGFVIAVLKGGLLTRERYALLLILLTYAIQNLFVFDTVSTFPLLLFLFVYAHIRETDTTAPYPKKGLAKLGYAKAAVFVLLLIPVVILPSYANVLASTGYKYHVTDVQKANELFDQSYSLDTYIDIELGWQLYTMYTTRQQHLTDPNDRLAAYDKAYAVLSQNAERYPYDARTLTYLAHVIDSRPAEAPYDEEAYRTLLARILELSPKRAQTWYLTANILLKEGDKLAGAAREAKYEEAMSVLEEYSALVPDIATPYFIKANLYIALGNFTKAEEAFAEGEQLYQKGRREDARRATAYLITREEFERVEPYLEDLVVEEPTKENIYDLAKIKYINGKLDEAVRLVNRVYILDKTYIKSDPSFLAAFLSAYNEGGSTVKLNIEL
jgi:tetratricopeptide (TPR) repeat protein